MKKIFLWLLIVSMIAVFTLAGCKAEAVEEEVSKSAQTATVLKPGKLPSEAATALDAAIERAYCSPESFTAKSVRMIARMKGVGSDGYVELSSTGAPGLPFAARDGDHATLRPVAPESVQVRGRGDGTDISIRNYEQFVIETDDDTVLGSFVVAKGSRLHRQDGMWVLSE